MSTAADANVERNKAPVSAGYSVPVKILLCQLVLGGVVAAVLLLVNLGAVAAALLATAVVTIPNAIYVWREWLLAQGGQLDYELQARLALLQMLLRLGLTMVLLVACIIVLRPAPVPFIGTLILLQLAHALTPITGQKQT